MPRARLRALPGLALVATLGLAACGGGAAAEELRADVPRQSVPLGGATAVPDVVTATDRLGLDLLGLGDEVNAVVSPASAAVALAMLAEGAEGTSEAELDELLGASGRARTDAYNALSAQLEPMAGDPAVVQDDDLPETPVVHLANNVVVDDGAEVLDSYLQRLAAGFGAGMQAADLGSAEGKDVLDGWVREHTGGLIEQSAIQPDPLLRLVLQNAVVVAAPWQDPFDPGSTGPMSFTVADGTQTEVEAMAKRTATGYAEVQGWRAVRLHYAGGGLYADVLLPPEGTAPQSLPADLLDELGRALAEDAGGPAPQEVDLRLPKTDLRSRTPLLELLEDRTPSLVTAETADLSGISTAERLFVSQASQQATLTVDEAGTVAAAVTELGMAGSGMPEEPVRLSVDRPYLFRIAEAETGWTLFLARIGDPRA
jgi:serine protease inhibitor